MGFCFGERALSFLLLARQDAIMMSLDMYTGVPVDVYVYRCACTPFPGVVLGEVGNHLLGAEECVRAQDIPMNGE